MSNTIPIKCIRKYNKNGNVGQKYSTEIKINLKLEVVNKKR
jgi:hypothetical protein